MHTPPSPSRNPALQEVAQLTAKIAGMTEVWSCQCYVSFGRGPYPSIEFPVFFCVAFQLYRFPSVLCLCDPSRSACSWAWQMCANQVMCAAAIMDAEDIAGEEEELHRLRKLHHCIVPYRPLPCNGERRCEQTFMHRGAYLLLPLTLLGHLTNATQASKQTRLKHVHGHHGFA